jgi:predicted acetyltransferase
MCCLFGASTKPEFRRRGVQAAMTFERLRMAAKAGCKIAVVMTQPGSGSQRNMERQGFRVAYTKFVMVKEWDNAPASATS